MQAHSFNDSKACVNIDGLCRVHCQVEGLIYILFEDRPEARRAHKASGTEVCDELMASVLQVEDRPVVSGDVEQKIANAGLNIELIYMAANTRLVTVADDLDKA